VTHLIGWGCAGLAVAALVGLVAGLRGVYRSGCCDHPDLEDVSA